MFEANFHSAQIGLLPDLKINITSAGAVDPNCFSRTLLHQDPNPGGLQSYNGPCQADMPLPLRLLPGTFVPWPTRLSWVPFASEPAYILAAEPPARWLAPAAAAVPCPRWLAMPT